MNIANAGLSLEQKIAYLRTLPAIRERCGRVYELAKQGKLQYFDYNPDREDAAADYCIKIIEVTPFPLQTDAHLTLCSETLAKTTPR